MSSKRRQKQTSQNKGAPHVQALLLLLIPVLVVTLYGNSIKSPFAYDDRTHILENQLVTSFRSSFGMPAVHGLFHTPMGLAARPVLFLTYGLNYAASGADSAAFRWVNLVIHSLNSVLVFLIV